MRKKDMVLDEHYAVDGVEYVLLNTDCAAGGTYAVMMRADGGYTENVAYRAVQCPWDVWTAQTGVQRAVTDATRKVHTALEDTVSTYLDDMHPGVTQQVLYGGGDDDVWFRVESPRNGQAQKFYVDPVGSTQRDFKDFLRDYPDVADRTPEWAWVAVEEYRQARADWREAQEQLANYVPPRTLTSAPPKRTTSGNESTKQLGRPPVEFDSTYTENIEMVQFDRKMTQRKWDAKLYEAVDAAREAGVPWRQINEATGLTNTQQWYTQQQLKKEAKRA